MADEKKFTKEGLQLLLNRINDGDLTPGAIAKKYGSKAAVDQKAGELLSFLDKIRPDIKDREAFELWDSAKRRLTNQLSVGKKYAPTIENKGMATNLDDLNQSGQIKVAAKTPEAKALESMSSIAEQDAQGLKASFKQGKDVQGDFRGKMAGMPEAKTNALKGISKGKMGGGKLGALAALGTLGYQALKGEPVMAQDVFKAGAEAINPLPFSLEEMKQEMGKMDQTQNIQKMQQDLQNQKELERQKREEAARPQALEFGEKLNEMQKAKINVLKRMSEQ